jgi:lipoic acid synthetase
MTAENSTRIRKPAWLRQKLPVGPAYEHVRAMLKENRLHTVCQEAKCPNMWQCFSKQTATFLIMGPHCTRNCRFCSVEHGPPVPPDPAEPARVADAVKNMGLEYAVITSVTRDDLPDGGAQFFAQTVHEIHNALPDAQAEVLIPDFQGNADALQTVLDSGIAVLNHNLETVPRLYPSVRPEAIYRRSLNLLSQAKKYNAAIAAKSGLMLGLGETSNEIRRTLEDLRNSGCDLLTLGQYLQPSASHLPVKRFVHPNEFEMWRQTAIEMGFAAVASGPFVRSSYHAKELFCAIAF